MSDIFHIVTYKIQLKIKMKHFKGKRKKNNISSLHKLHIQFAQPLTNTLQKYHLLLI